jgi:hypothetical protein
VGCAAAHPGPLAHPVPTPRRLFAPLRSEGVQQVARWRGGFNGFAFRLPPAMMRFPNATVALLRALSALPQIKFIEPDQVGGYGRVSSAMPQVGRGPSS